MTKTNYTSISPGESNYLIRMVFFALFAISAYYGNIYRTNNNNMNAVIITASDVAATSLVRGGVSNGDGGQEDLSSISVGGSYIESKTNLFVEEGVGCGTGTCYSHMGNEKACNEQAGCYWYPHLVNFCDQHTKDYIPNQHYCTDSSGVSCGGHRAPSCGSCDDYDGKERGKSYCNGDCKWETKWIHESKCVSK